MKNQTLLTIVFVTILASVIVPCANVVSRYKTPPTLNSVDTASWQLDFAYTPNNDHSIPSMMVDDDGNQAGVKSIMGQMIYTNVVLMDGVTQPVVILEEQTGFINRDRKYVIPVVSQVLGRVTSKLGSSPLEYELRLPIQPVGTLMDVNHDDCHDLGVMVFAVVYGANTWGDPYLEFRDNGEGWTCVYASTRVSLDKDRYCEVYGGKYLVFAPDAFQQFPSGFGSDRKLFTTDDPIMPIPSGWSVIDMDREPFAIERDPQSKIDLVEPPSCQSIDFSNLSYTESFELLLDKLTREYAWTQEKNVCWDALGLQFRDKIRHAERNQDPEAFISTLNDFAKSIPDSHVTAFGDLLIKKIIAETEFGLGLTICETDDGKFVAVYVMEDGPAARAGITFGTEILSMKGLPIRQYIETVIPFSGPFSNPTVERIEKVHLATRFSSNDTIEIEFMGPGEAQIQKDSLVPISERVSLRKGISETRSNSDDALELPVAYKLLADDLGYIDLSSFSDDTALTVQLWERALRDLKKKNIKKLILDVRSNSGGDGILADQMAAYFFDEKIVVGNAGYYNPASGDFFMHPDDESTMVPPESDVRFKGDIAVLVGPNTASAAEFFAYNLTLQNRAKIVGYYPTAGAGGPVDQILMPDGVTVQFTCGRSVDTSGKIHIEGTGVSPNIRVPINLKNLRSHFKGVDVELSVAKLELAEAH
jgi:C-terminal processing protease CtpA/Prc